MPRGPARRRRPLLSGDRNRNGRALRGTRDASAADGGPRGPIRAPLPSAPSYASPGGRGRVVRIALAGLGVASVVSAFAGLERFRFASQTPRPGAFAPARFDAVSGHHSIADVVTCS